MTEAGFFRGSVPGRRGEILDAALEVFSEHGYDRGSMRRIAELVGVSEPALYRHFENKEELFMQLVGLAADMVASNVGQALDLVAPPLTAEELRAVLTERTAVARMFFPMVRVLLVECLRRPEFFETWRKRALVPLTAHVESLIERFDAAAGKRTDPKDRRARARSVMAVFIGYQITSLVFPDDDLGAFAKVVAAAVTGE